MYFALRNPQFVLRFPKSTIVGSECCLSHKLYSLLLTFLNHTIKNLAFAVGGTLPFLALVIWGWGDCATFFSNLARTGVIILAFAGAIAYAFSGSSGLGIGHREDPSSRWIFVPLIIIAVAFAWLPLHLDRLNRRTIDGDTWD